MALRSTAGEDAVSLVISKVLVVDDDPSNRVMLAVTLEEAGYHVLTAANPLAARSLLRDEAIDLLVSDLRSPRASLEFVEWVRSRYPGLPVVLLTEELEGDDARRVGRLRDTTRVGRPIRGLMLLTAIDGALHPRSVAV